MLFVTIVGAIIVVLGASVFFGAPYVPTRRRDMRRLFDQLIPLTADDVVLDFGCGDGVVLREVSRRGARAVGYEIHPVFATIAKVLSRGDARVTVRMVNAWVAPFPDNITLVYAFSVGRDGKRLAQKMQRETDRLARPVRVVCFGNPLPGYQPRATYEAYYLYTFEPLHLN